jgi:uncharacterized metal-binding protein YceD (DUF177 family)
MNEAEFSRMVEVGQADGRRLHLTASEAECAALARRFDLISVKRLEASVELTREGTTVSASGTLSAKVVQSCAISGEDLPSSIKEPLSLRFVPQTEPTPGEELELTAEDCDEIPYSGTSLDIGEAVAQSLALAIDPFAEGPQAEAARQAAGLLGPGEDGPFAALAALRKGPS